MSLLNMTNENFLEQVNLAEQLTSSDFGVSTGSISQGYWEASKWYFVNAERGNIADKLQPRNIKVSFTNNSNVPIDVIISTTTRVPCPPFLHGCFCLRPKKEKIYFETLKKISYLSRRNFLLSQIVKNLLPFP